MPCPGIGPCEVWDLDLSCCLTPSGSVPNPCILEGQPVPQDVIDSAKLAASQFLWKVTGMQFGCCQVTIQPCKDCGGDCPGLSGGSYDGFWGYPWYPVHTEAGWTNITCPCEDSCLCGSCAMELPYPVCSVDEVVIGGIVLPPDAYRVDDFHRLVLTPSVTGDTPDSNCWKGCDNSIKVTYGQPVPELVRIAAQEFACQLIKSCQGAPCQLPQRVQSISRQGVSVSFLDPQDFLDKGRTGIYLVDIAIKAYNPNLLMRRPTVYSPDYANKWRVETWKPGDPIGPNCT